MSVKHILVAAAAALALACNAGSPDVKEAKKDAQQTGQEVSTDVKKATQSEPAQRIRSGAAEAGRGVEQAVGQAAQAAGQKLQQVGTKAQQDAQQTPPPTATH